MSRRPTFNGGQVKSPLGTVHHLSTRVRLGLRTTRCGQYVDRGWGSTAEEVTCRNCVRLGGEASIARKVAIR